MVASDLVFRRAMSADIPDIVRLLSDDAIGASRELGPGNLEPYHQAFAQIDADPSDYLCVVEQDGRIVGTLHLKILSSLSRAAAKRGQIESVRVSSECRGQRIGERMFAWAIDECRARGCSIVQLTTDKARVDAHRFYDRLGFQASHVGYKLMV